MATPRNLAALSLILLAACSSSDPKLLTDEGQQALGRGDAAAALESFDQARAHMTPQSADYLRASMGRFRALARLDKTGKMAKDEFLAFQKAQAGRVQDVDFKTVVDALLAVQRVQPAAELVEAGKQAFPDSAVMKQLVVAVGNAAKQAKNGEAMDRMRGIGYVGDD
jgi:major membrane immunogen (membrane-anchored lipoprotein)